MRTHCGSSTIVGVVVALVALAVNSGVNAVNEQPDVLPYTSVMLGVSSSTFVAGGGADTEQGQECTPTTTSTEEEGSVALAATAIFYPETTVATISLFAQIHLTGNNRSSGAGSTTREMYRVCYNEPFTITTNDADSHLRFDAAHDPLSCLSRFLLTLLPDDSCVRSAFLPVNLTAVARPYDPDRLLTLHLFDGWTVVLQPVVPLDSVLNHATSGPVTALDDAMVAFCSPPGTTLGSTGGNAGGVPGWSVKLLFAGAYNLALHATAITSSPGGNSQGVVCGGAAGHAGHVAVGPLTFRMAGGRLDIAGRGDDAAVPNDAVNTTLRCIRHVDAGATTNDEQASGAYVFVVGNRLSLIVGGRAVQLTPAACWQTLAFGRVDVLSALTGRRYAGHYGDLAIVSIEFGDIVPTPSSSSAQAVVLLRGNVSTPTFTARCDDKPGTPVVMESAGMLGILSNGTSCLGQALSVVAGSPWMRIEYINGADAVIISLYTGAFVATRVP